MNRLHSILLKKIEHGHGSQGHGQLPFSLLGNGVGVKSAPRQPTEKEQSMVMDHKAMTNSPSPSLHPTEKKQEHLHSTLLRKTRAWPRITSSWPTPLFLTEEWSGG